MVAMVAIDGRTRIASSRRPGSGLSMGCMVLSPMMFSGRIESAKVLKSSPMAFMMQLMLRLARAQTTSRVSVL